MIWPSVADERAVALKKLGLPAETSVWKRYRLHVQIAFFILTLIGISAFSVFSFVNRTAGSLINAVIVLVLAEVLIAMNRFFETGVETALWLAGVVYILLALPHTGSKEGILVVGALVAIAGARLLNPVIGGLAAMSIVIYAAVKNATPLQCALVGIVIALVAAAAQLIEWQRQSVERLFQTIAILAPLAGVIAAQFGSSIDHQMVAIVYIIAAAIILALGVATRARALLLSGALNAAIAAYEASYLSDAPLEAKLIVAGVVVLAIAIILSRTLRNKTAGFVTTESSLTGYDELMQIAGAIHTSPDAPAEQPTGGGFQGGGGSFGGGGASAGY
ncbi:MAG TPA: hypothetical protein VGR95_12915 [Thermoanaerobaculia bacterium]|jgi:uncharacterized membrane protein YgcG|nr:hypothetical protein [Thermoanaerobaculia bacterium]